MNWKRFFIAFIATFVFVFLFGYLWWGTLMHSAHMEVPALFRAEADFPTYFPWLVIAHIVMAFFLTLLGARYNAAGAAGGARLGFLLSFIFAGVDLINYAVMPLTTKIVAGWIVGDVLMLTIAGAIIGAIYKPGATTSGANV